MTFFIKRLNKLNILILLTIKLLKKIIKYKNPNFLKMIYIQFIKKLWEEI